MESSTGSLGGLVEEFKRLLDTPRVREANRRAQEVLRPIEAEWWGMTEKEQQRVFDMSVQRVHQLRNYSLDSAEDPIHKWAFYSLLQEAAYVRG